MDEKELKRRIVELENEVALHELMISKAEETLEQSRTNLAMSSGALTECRAWLERLSQTMGPKIGA